MNRSTMNILEAPALEPSFESFQTPVDVIVVAHLPSVVKEEVKLSGDEKSITITITGPSDPQQIARMGYYSHEVTRLYGYSKKIEFPTTVNFPAAKATFKHGILEVRIPKV